MTGFYLHFPTPADVDSPKCNQKFYEKIVKFGEMSIDEKRRLCYNKLIYGNRFRGIHTRVQQNVEERS